MRRKGDESAVGKPRCEVAGSDPLSRLNGFRRDVLEPVLADNDRSTLAWLQIPRYQQKPPSRTLRKNVDDDFVSDPPR